MADPQSAGAPGTGPTRDAMILRMIGGYKASQALVSRVDLGVCDSLARSTT